MKAKQILSVGEMAKRSGLAVSAIHFYEKKGLISSVRNEQNQRQFHRGVLRVISLIKVAQRLGFSLEQIQGMFRDLPKDSEPTAADRRRFARRWQQDLDEKMSLIKRLKNQLDKCIGCGCLSMKECPLRNPEDKLASKGAGPHYL